MRIPLSEVWFKIVARFFKPKYFSKQLSAINYFIVDMKDLLQLTQTIFTFIIWTLHLLVYYRTGQTWMTVSD